MSNKVERKNLAGVLSVPAKIAPMCEEFNILCELLQDYFEAALFTFFLLILPLQYGIILSLEL